MKPQISVNIFVSMCFPSGKNCYALQLTVKKF